MQYKGGPKKPKIYFLKIVYLFLMFKLLSPSKYFPFDIIHLWRHFFHCSKLELVDFVFELVDFDAF